KDDISALDVGGDIAPAEFGAQRPQVSHRQLAPPDIHRPQQRHHPPHRFRVEALRLTSRCNSPAASSPLDARANATAGAPMEIRTAFKRRGLLYVLSSPSGAGKSTIARKLLAIDEGIALSVSATTRPIRPGEVDGRDYHFVDDARF